MSKTFYLVANLDSTERADKYLQELFSENEDLDHISRSQIQKLIESGSILVNGKAIRTKDSIAPASSIEVTLPDPTPIEVVAENIPIQILFEDEHLIVVNKQPGLTVHPSDTQANGTLVNALLYHVKDLSGIGGKLRPGIVHRIDKDTSGALVISKHDEAHTGLAKLFATHDIDRKYWTLTYGALRTHESMRVETTLARSPNDRKKMAVNIEGGRNAISHFLPLEAYGLPQKIPFASMVEATLETGRTHQVRVHLNHLGYSILGDPTYGTPNSAQPKWKALPKAVQAAVEALPGQALHARVLGFVHPITGEKLHFEAEPYPEFARLLIELKKFS
jgi:23S rRNA pseudouridine1911/1915/1917 synthase